MKHVLPITAVAAIAAMQFAPCEARSRVLLDEQAGAATGLSEVTPDTWSAEPGAEIGRGFEPIDASLTLLERRVERAALTPRPGSETRERADVADAIFPDPGPRNYRGEVVPTAPVRYVEDFEGTLGREWAASPRVTERGELSRFAGPKRTGSVAINVEVTPGTPYTINFDALVLGLSDAGSIEVKVDGAPVLSRSAGFLKRENERLHGEEEWFDPRRVPEVNALFVASGEVAEVRFVFDAGGAPGGWGVDNILIDEMSLPMAAGGGGGAGYAPRGDAATAPDAPTGRNPGVTNVPSGVRPTPGRGGGGGEPRDFTDLFDDFDDELENEGEDPEPPMDDPPDDDPPPPDTPLPPDDDPENPDDPDIPAPGTLMLLGALGVMGARRRR